MRAVSRPSVISIAASCAFSTTADMRFSARDRPSNRFALERTVGVENALLKTSASLPPAALRSVRSVKSNRTPASGRGMTSPDQPYWSSDLVSLDALSRCVIPTPGLLLLTQCAQLFRRILRDRQNTAAVRQDVAVGERRSPASNRKQRLY